MTVVLGGCVCVCVCDLDPACCMLSNRCEQWCHFPVWVNASDLPKISLTVSISKVFPAVTW